MLNRRQAILASVSAILFPSYSKAGLLPIGSLPMFRSEYREGEIIINVAGGQILNVPKVTGFERIRKSQLDLIFTTAISRNIVCDCDDINQKLFDELSNHVDNLRYIILDVKYLHYKQFIERAGLIPIFVVVNNILARKYNFPYKNFVIGCSGNPNFLHYYDNKGYALCITDTKSVVIGTIP